MSLKDTFPKAIPEETLRVVEPLLAEDSVYRLIGQYGDEIISDDDFVTMYAGEGRPGVNPVILAFVTVFQYMEKLADRRAAEMARTRLDWKYALRQELDWPSFHYSDLCNFRKRLLINEQEMMIFERVVKYLQDKGHIKGKGKQRTDSTHIVGKVMKLSRLEVVWETIRLAVSALVSTDAPWSLQHLPSVFVETHSSRRDEYRLSESQVKAEMQQAGADGYWLVARVEQQGKHLQSRPEIQCLKRVLEEQFTPPEDKQPPKARLQKDCIGDGIVNPHDPDARYGNKGTQQWLGYKLQVTETVGEGQNFITDCVVTSTKETDNQALPAIHQRLAERQLLPGLHYGDQGYVNGATIEHSQDDYGIDLRGYVNSGHSCKPAGFRLRDFIVDSQHQRAVCPAEREAERWVPTSANRQQQKRIAYRVWFGTACRSCPFFAKHLCTTDRRGRALDLSPYHDTLQVRRQEMQSPQFAKEMYTRHGIEGTISEVVRAHGARYSRYRGLVKNLLQAAFIAAATNLKRLAKALTLLLLSQQRAFARLAMFSEMQWVGFSTESSDLPLHIVRNIIGEANLCY